MSGVVIKTDAKKIAGQLDRRKKKIRRAIALGANAGARQGRALLVSRTPKDTGLLKASWKVQKSAQAVGFFRQMQLATIFNDAPYAGIVEKGARPHPVSAAGIEALKQWAWRNRRLFGFITKSGRAQSGDAVKKAVEGIAYAIAEKIRKKGQRPKYFVRDSIPEIERMLKTEIDRFVAKVAADKEGE